MELRSSSSSSFCRSRYCIYYSLVQFTRKIKHSISLKCMPLLIRPWRFVCVLGYITHARHSKFTDILDTTLCDKAWNKNCLPFASTHVQGRVWWSPSWWYSYFSVLYFFVFVLCHVSDVACCVSVLYFLFLFCFMCLLLPAVSLCFPFLIAPSVFF